MLQLIRKGLNMKRLMWFVTATLVAALGGSAQDWAKARLEKSSRHPEWVKDARSGHACNRLIARVLPADSLQNIQAREPTGLARLHKRTSGSKPWLFTWVTSE